jgi:hypothetical protein
MEKKYGGYLISSQTTEVETDQRGTISITRWRVSQIDRCNSQIKRILRDGFDSENEAIAYADSLYAKEHKQSPQ